MKKQILKQCSIPVVMLMAFILFEFLFPTMAYASFENSLIDMKTKLTGAVLPVLSVIGILIASFSYMTGNPNARQHIIYALIGVGVGYGAQVIVDFIGSTIR